MKRVIAAGIGAAFALVVVACTTGGAPANSPSSEPSPSATPPASGRPIPPSTHSMSAPVPPASFPPLGSGHLVASAIPSGTVTPPPAIAECKTDADCVPATCCHPNTCVPAGQKPDCHDAVCTRECRGATFDCGGGGCVCHEGKCDAQLTPKVRKKP